MPTPVQFDLLGFPIAAPDAAPVVATYQRYSMLQIRHQCGRCALACHVAALHGGPIEPPGVGCWRRQYGEDVEYLCYRHKAEAHAEDNTAGRLAKQAPARRGTRVTA